MNPKQATFPPRILVLAEALVDEGLTNVYVNQPEITTGLVPYYSESLLLRERQAARAGAFDEAEEFFREQMTMCSETGQDPEGSRQSMESCREMAKAARKEGETKLSKITNNKDTK